MLPEPFSQGRAGDLLFIAVFIFKIQYSFVLRRLIGPMTADVYNIVLPLMQGFIQFGKRRIVQKLDHDFWLFITGGFQSTDRTNETGLLFFDLQHFTPLIQVFGQGSDKQHFQRSCRSMITMQFKGCERGFFGPHQTKIVDCKAVFGLGHFGRKQCGQDHFKWQVDNAVIIGRNGQEQFFYAPFFQQLDKISTHLTNIPGEKGLKEQLG